MMLNSVPFAGFLLLILILFVQIIVLRKKGIQLSANAGSKKKKVSKFLLLVFVLIFLLWIFELSRAAFGFSLKMLPDFLISHLTESYYLKGFGSIYIAIGLFAFALTLLHFGNSLRFGLNKEIKGKLVTTGIFSLSRNPFFLSLEFFFFGITLILPSLFFIGFTLSAFIGIHFFILKEERFMTENYGDEYKEYQQKTRRYL